MSEKEASGQELAKVYRSGATLAKTGAETGLGRFAVAYRLEKAGVERRNRGTPQKTAEEKAGFALQQLEATFGETWPKVKTDLQTGAAVATALATEKGIKPFTFLSWLNRADIEIPRKAGKHKLQAAVPKPPSEPLAAQKRRKPTVLDIADVNEPLGLAVLEKLNKCGVPARFVADFTDEELIARLHLTKGEVAHVRAQLKKNKFSS